MNLDVNENPQKVNYVSTIDIPSDEVVSLTFGQSIDIEVLIDTLSFKNFSGFLDQDAMVDSSTIELDNDTKVDKATLESGKMILTITNEVGIAADVDFTIAEFIKNGIFAILAGKGDPQKPQNLQNPVRFIILFALWRKIGPPKITDSAKTARFIVLLRLWRKSAKSTNCDAKRCV